MTETRELDQPVVHVYVSAQLPHFVVVYRHNLHDELHQDHEKEFEVIDLRIQAHCQNEVFGQMCEKWFEPCEEID